MIGWLWIGVCGAAAVAAYVASGHDVGTAIGVFGVLFGIGVFVAVWADHPG